MLARCLTELYATSCSPKNLKKHIYKNLILKNTQVPHPTVCNKFFSCQNLGHNRRDSDQHPTMTMKSEWHWTVDSICDFCDVFLFPQIQVFIFLRYKFSFCSDTSFSFCSDTKHTFSSARRLQCSPPTWWSVRYKYLFDFDSNQQKLVRQFFALNQNEVAADFKVFLSDLQLCQRRLLGPAKTSSKKPGQRKQRARWEEGKG